jgi:hypothetical protein
VFGNDKKKEPRTATHHDDNEIIFKSKIRNYLDHEKRISELEIKIEDFNERPEKIKIKIIIILNDRLRNLKTENKKLDDIIKNRDRIITNLNNQIVTLKRERTEFRKYSICVTILSLIKQAL